MIKMLEKANRIRFINAMKNKYYLYEIINKNPNSTIYDLTKITNWSSGKIKHYIDKLLKDEVIHNSTEIKNGRVKKEYSPVKFTEFIDREKINNKE